MVDKAVIAEANSTALNRVLLFVEAQSNRKTIADVRNALAREIVKIDEIYEKEGLVPQVYFHEALKAAYNVVKLRLEEKDPRKSRILNMYESGEEKMPMIVLMFVSEYFASHHRREPHADIMNYGTLAKLIFEDIKQRLFSMLEAQVSLMLMANLHRVDIEKQLEKMKEFVLEWVFSDFPNTYDRHHVLAEIKPLLVSAEKSFWEGAAAKSRARNATDDCGIWHLGVFQGLR